MIPLLLIEDEKDLGLIIADNLRSDEYEVSHYLDGHDGLTAFFLKKPAIVILDVMLPGLDGFKVAQKLEKMIGKLLFCS